MYASGDTSRQWSRLVLVGFMGAGKSTVGAILAASLGLPFLDTDTIIEQQTATPIAGLFEEVGEARFRVMEEEVVAQSITKDGVVIALGGGALESPATRRLLGDSFDTCVIHLEAPLPVMLERCREPVQTRPLLRDQQSLIQRHARRLEHYRSADITVNTEGLTPEAVVEQLLRNLARDSRWNAIRLEASRSGRRQSGLERSGLHPSRPGDDEAAQP